jgi:SAM-dependent methyltransferase
MPQDPADGYRTEWLEAEQHSGGRHHILQLLDELRQSLPIRGGRVLELGSGLGANLRVLARDNQVQGVEGLRAAAERACQLGTPTLVADLEQDQLPWPDASWDWVLMLDVLEHLVRPEQALQQARRLLAPGGRLLVNVPNAHDWRSRWHVLRGAGIDAPRYFPQVPVWRYPHLRFFRHGDLLQLLRHAGFEPECDYSGRQPSLPKARHWPRIAGRLAARWPDLAASGFFVVARPVAAPSAVPQ